MIKDSGNRTEFETGAVRDIQKDKGRCDLMPLKIIGVLINSSELMRIDNFKCTGNVKFLYQCISDFANRLEIQTSSLMLDVAKHFEEGAKKYGENNWQKGISISSYINSAVRHLLKFISGWDDEPHDRAFVWNILCCIWTMENKPELDNFTEKD